MTWNTIRGIPEAKSSPPPLCNTQKNYKYLYLIYPLLYKRRPQKLKRLQLRPFRHKGYALQGLWIPRKGMEVLHNLQKPPVRVWKSNRTHRSSGYCMEILQNSRTWRVHIWCCARTRTSTPMFYKVSGTGYIPRRLPYFWLFSYKTGGYGYAMLYPYLGYCVTGVQNLQKFRVREWMTYRTQRTHKSSGYGYECRTERTEAFCSVIPGVFSRVWFCMYRNRNRKGNPTN